MRRDTRGAGKHGDLLGAGVECAGRTVSVGVGQRPAVEEGAGAQG